MLLIGYINDPTEPEFLALGHGMEYIMNHTHEPIIYARKNISKTNERSIECFFKAVNS